MGRHATVAGRMAASAAAKGKVFTKIAREIMVAAKAGGGDAATNAALRLAMDHAREHNMPKENVERAIKKGCGELGENERYEEVTYEGYGPGGTAFLVECLTDNRNRTNPEIKRIFQKCGCTMGEMGSVGWMFQRKGVVYLSAEGLSEDKVMEITLDAGAEDLQSGDGMFIVYTPVPEFAAVRDACINASFTILKSGLEMVPNNFIQLSGEDAKAAQELYDKLDDQDDAQNVYHNFETA